MSTIQSFVMHHSGTIPGVGPVDGGQTVYVDLGTMQIVSVSPIIQRPMGEQPLAAIPTPTNDPTEEAAPTRSSVEDTFERSA